MNSKIFSILFSILLLFAIPALAQDPQSEALDGLNKTAGSAQVDKIGGTDPISGLTTFLGGTINYLFGVVIIVFITIMMIGGYLWMGAGGNDEKVSKAKTFILNGLFGLMVIFLSYALVYVILFSLNDATNGS